VEDLDPPDSLKDAHDDLLAAGEATPRSASPAEVRAQAERFLGIYQRLGADGCATMQRAALNRFPGSS
jgi:hypothetical protein